jgi:hypothetical protein
VDTSLTEKVEALRNRLAALERQEPDFRSHQRRICKLEDRVDNLARGVNTLFSRTEAENEFNGDLEAETEIFSTLLKMGVKGLIVSDERGDLAYLFFTPK